MGAHRTPINATAEGNTPVTVPASQATAVVSKPTFGLNGYAHGLLVAVNLTSVVNASGTAVLKVQHASAPKADGSYVWSTIITSAALSASGTEQVVEMRITEADAAQVAKFPLGIVARVICTTGAGDTVVVRAVTAYTDNH